MIAVPVLVQFLPLSYAVPLILLLDLVVTTIVGYRNWAHVSVLELRRLLPFLLVGVFIGATALASLDAKWLLIGLGIFVLTMAARSLWQLQHSMIQIRPVWAMPAGLVGGAFSALFGTGGPIYTMYLSRRLSNPDEFRSTISSVIFLSAVVRIAAFAATDLLQQDGLLRSAGFALPLCLLGLATGSYFRRRISALAIKRALFVFLALGGVGVVYRGLAL